MAGESQRRESLRQEAARRGVTVYRVRAERARARGSTYATEREERARNAMLRLHPQYVRPEDFPLVSDEEPHGFQGPFSPSPDPAWDYRWPTGTAFPNRPRTLKARYSRQYSRLEVEFARPSRSNPGGTWHYDMVPPRIWNRFKRVESPGRYINAVLNAYPMGPGGWGVIVGEGEGEEVGDWEG